MQGRKRESEHRLLEFRIGIHHGKIEKRTLRFEVLEEIEEIEVFEEIKEFEEFEEFEEIKEIEEFKEIS